MPIDYQEAWNRLRRDTLSLSQLYDLVDEVTGSVRNAPQNSVYLLFSGRMWDGETPALDVAGNLVGPGVYDIGESEIGRLMRSDAFNQELRNAIARDLGYDPNTLTSGQQTQVSERFLLLKDGMAPDGITRISGGSSSFWDIASEKFVAEARGDFRIITTGPIHPDSVFATSELRALLENVNVGNIDGIPRSELAARGVQKALSSIPLRAAEIAHFTSLSATNPQAWLSLSDSYLQAARQDQALLTQWAQRHQQRFGDARFADASTWMADLYKRVDSIPGASRLLKSLGPISVLSSFLVASSNASAASSEQQKREIWEEWAVENVASEIGNLVGAMLGTLAVGVAAAAGVTIGAPLAIAIILGASITGGFFGGEGGKSFYDLLRDSDQNGQRDIFDKLGNLLGGATPISGQLLPPDLDGGKLTIDASLTREEIIARARDDIAWRYALRELNPFVISDVSYAAHNTDGSLDLYDEATGTGTMSRQYLADRATMLQWKLKWDKAGSLDEDDVTNGRLTQKPYGEDWDANAVVGNWDYVDLSRTMPGGPLTLSIDGAGLSLHDHQIVFGSNQANLINGDGDEDHLYGMGGDDSLNGLAGNDYLEGGAGNDTLIGGNGADELVGGAGNDSLDGGTGPDTLIGGQGVDTYRFAANWGHDVIDDSDGQAVLQFESFPQGLPQGKKIGDGKYQSANGAVTYTVARTADDKLNLLISIAGTANALTIRNWTHGQFGISFDEVPTPPTTTHQGDQQANLHDHLVANSSSSTHLIGLSGNDVLMGNVGNDLIEGGSGSDLLGGNGGADVLRGGTGDDFLFGSTAASSPIMWGERPLTDSWAVYITPTIFHIPGFSYWTEAQDQGNVLEGDGGQDWIAAGTGSDVARGGEGNDTLWGMGGHDYLNGEDGNDAMVGDSWEYLDGNSFVYTPIDAHGSDTLVGGTGDDTLYGAGGDDELHGSDDNDRLNGDGHANSISPAYHGNDTLDGGSGSDLLYGDGGEDELFGGTGEDTLVGDRTHADLDGAQHRGDYLDGEEGNDQLFGQGGSDTLYGGADNDTLSGDGPATDVAGTYHGDDYLDGEDGNDSIFGGGASDTLYGGAGADSMSGDLRPDQLAGTFHAADYLDGEGGNDSIFGNGGDDTLYGGADDDRLFGDTAADIPAEQLEAQFHGNDYLDGEAGHDELNGAGGLDTLYGGEGNDTLLGDDKSPRLGGEGHADDFIDGEGGNDSLEGGGRDDSLYGGEGNDTIWGDDVEANLEVAFHGEDFIDGGAGDDQLNGNAGDDAIWGGAGLDAILGGRGDDYLDGGDDDDLITGDDRLDRLPSSGHGHDTLEGGAGNDTLFGAGGNDLLGGGTGSDYLIGEDDGQIPSQALAGNDTLRGDEGADFLYGGFGQDLLDGGADNDYLSAGDGNDQLDGGSGADDLLAGMGDDTGTGGTGDDRVYGEAGNDSLRGGEGNDWLAGEDESTTTAVSASTGDDLLEGEAGNDTLVGGNGHDTLVGGTGVDYLFGGAGDDRLDGRDDDASSDFLYGGEGNDVIVLGAGDGGNGGSGNDTYVIGQNSRHAAIVLQQGGDGIDHIVFEPGISLESVSLQRLARPSFGGEESDDLAILLAPGVTIIAVNYFQSAADAEASPNRPLNLQFNDGTVLTPTAVAALATTNAVHEYSILYNDAPQRGSVRVADTNDSYSLEGGVEDARLLGNASGWLYGNSLNNLLTGNDAGNALYGADGNDTLVSGLGNDTLDGGNGHDLLTSNGGDDILQGGLGNDDLGASYFGTGGLLALGGEGSDTLWGNGNDTLDGGTGDDIVYSAAGTNIFRFGRGDGHDTAVRGQPTGRGILELKPGISPSDVLLRGAPDAGERSILRILDTGDTFRMWGFNPLDPTGIAATVHEIRFADGTIWDLATLIAETRKPTADNDYIGGSLGNDTLSGEDGDDYLVGEEGNDLLLGGEGDDLLYGDHRLTNIAGNDTLDGGAGDDYLDGGAGINTYVVGRGNGNDTIAAINYADRDGSISTLVFQDGITASDVSFWQSRTGIVVRVNGTTDQVLLEGFESVSGVGDLGNVHQIRFSDGTVWSRAQVFAEVFKGTDGDDTFFGSDIGDTIAGNAGHDVLYGNGGADSLNGGTGNDSLHGGSGNDTMEGGDGDDVFDTFTDASNGSDRMVGGRGDDSYFVGSTSDVVVELANEGHDTITSLVSLTMASNVENLALQVRSEEATTGLSGTGNGLANRIDGSRAGDTLTGGQGHDTLRGSTGHDTYVFNRGDGMDLIHNRDVFYSDSDEDIVAIDTLRFGSGIATTDVLASRSDDDLVLKIRNTSDQITINDHFAAPVEFSGYNYTIATDHAIDRIVFSNGTVWQAQQIESAVALAAANRSPVAVAPLPALTARQGSAFSYIIPASTFTDPDSGDWLTYQVVMRDGSDLPAWLAFDPATRTLSGNPGSAALGLLELEVVATDGYGASARAAAPLTIEPNRAPVLAAPLADQTAAQGSVFTYTVPANAFADDPGNALSFAATLADGTALPTWINFNATTRTLTGTPPNTGTTSIRIVASDGGGLSTTDVFDLVVSVQNLVLSGTSGADTLTGAGGNDQIGGLAGNDRLLGMAGADTLTGGTGSDTMLGGDGNDIYSVDASTDVVTELANAGTDVVQSTATFTLSDNVENLTLTGTSGISGTGNALDNYMIGNSAANRLTGGAGHDTIDGGAGSDTMVGQTGDDTYFVNATTDVVTELANEGTDSIRTTVTLSSLAANVENLTLLGTSALSGTGNDLHNIITGNSAGNRLTGGNGNDTLDGGLGSDTLVGGADNDTYVVNVSTDVITESSGAGTDTVLTAVTWSFASNANLENLTLTGSNAINGTGNAAANVLTGNGAANTLTGANGADTLDGGAGNDIVDGGAGADTYLFGRSHGQDTIRDTDSTAGVVDRLQFGTGIVQSDLSYSRVGNNLEALINGTTDKVIVQNWYLGNQYHVEQFRFADGSTLSDSQVQGLVSAMASFSASAAGSTSEGRTMTRGTPSGHLLSANALA